MPHSRRQSPAWNLVEPRSGTRTVGTPSDPLGYDMSNFGMAVDMMVDDVRTGRTTYAVEKELAAVRRRYRSIKRPTSGVEMPRPRRRSNARDATPVDVQVGIRVRTRRLELDMSQAVLAEACKITFQQIQKYENGANRISASRLWQFAAVMNVPVDYFFEGLGKNVLPAAVAKRLDAEQRDGVGRDMTIDDETIKLARRIAGLQPELRKKLKGMLSAISRS
jgi:transcriptional regulator with XRE-family HTH domain